jgi:Fic family protein
MHRFDYKKTPGKLLTPEIVNLLSALHEYKGKQSFYTEAEPAVLSALVDIAKVQSTKASNRIEGIFTTDDRLNELVMKKTTPRNRSEEEIAGYREVLATIHENYEYITARTNTILQMHRDLYSFSNVSVGGSFKNSDNVIAESDDEGHEKVRFVPVPSFQTPEAVEDLCNRFNEAIEAGDYDSLLLIPMFVLDFLCIHPFNDGNGRMSRLLTLLLLYRSGYVVGKYISMEMLIEKSKETYYEVLQESSINWHESKNDYIPFIRYYLGILIRGYKEFQERLETLHSGSFSKEDAIKSVIDRKLGKITKAEIISMCPNISQTTIERALNRWLREGYIVKVGNGRTTGYVKKE